MDSTQGWYSVSFTLNIKITRIDKYINAASVFLKRNKYPVCSYQFHTNSEKNMIASTDI